MEYLDLEFCVRNAAFYGRFAVVGRVESKDVFETMKKLKRDIRKQESRHG